MGARVTGLKSGIIDVEVETIEVPSVDSIATRTYNLVMGESGLMLLEKSMLRENV